MAKLNFNLENEILNCLKEFQNKSSKEIYEGLNNIAAYATVKRTIQELLDQNYIITNGREEQLNTYLVKV